MPRRQSYYEDDWHAGYDAGYKDGYNAGWRAANAQDDIVTRPSKTKKRRKTAYQSAYSAAYKRLKKKHPRMSFGSLSKKAHAAARKKVK